MKALSRSDEILLLSVLRLKDNAYGVTIIKDIQQRTGKTLTFGGLWVSMDVLAKRGLVEKRLADPTPQRGGRSKIYYSISNQGIKALEETRSFHNRIWSGLPARLGELKPTD